MFEYTLLHWMTFLSVAVLLNLSPGPDIAYILGQTLRSGRRQGFAAMFGMDITADEPVQSIINWGLWVQLVVLAFVLMLLTQWFLRNHLLGDVLCNMVWWKRSALLFVFLVLIVMGSGENDAFIYFQF